MGSQANCTENGGGGEEVAPGPWPSSKMKLLDYILVALIVACMFIGYSGHQFIALVLFLLVLTFACWRFWDRRQAEKFMRGTSSTGELHPQGSLADSSHDGSGVDVEGED